MEISSSTSTFPGCQSDGMYGALLSRGAAHNCSRAEEGAGNVGGRVLFRGREGGSAPGTIQSLSVRNSIAIPGRDEYFAVRTFLTPSRGKSFLGSRRRCPPRPPRDLPLLFLCCVEALISQIALVKTQNALCLDVPGLARQESRQGYGPWLIWGIVSKEW